MDGYICYSTRNMGMLNTFPTNLAGKHELFILPTSVVQCCTRLNKAEIDDMFSLLLVSCNAMERNGHKYERGLA